MIALQQDYNPILSWEPKAAGVGVGDGGRLFVAALVKPAE